MKKHTQFAILATFSTALAPAAITVTDSGLTAPTIGASDTGYTGVTTNRWGWDSGEGFTQTFTLGDSGVLQSIFVGYNGFDDSDTITLDLLVNGNAIENGIFLDGANFSGNASSDDNNGVFYWMEFDLSSENIPVDAGLNSFTLNATANTGTSWALAPRYNATTSVYTGGALSLNFSNTTGDMAFAVTTAPIPEPSGIALIGLGALGFLARRRR